MLDNDRKFKKMFSKMRSNAKFLKVDFEINFTDWKQIWIDSGKWEQQGRKLDQYRMRRVDKNKGWTNINVQIAEGRQGEGGEWKRKV